MEDTIRRAIRGIGFGLNALLALALLDWIGVFDANWPWEEEGGRIPEKKEAVSSGVLVEQLGLESWERIRIETPASTNRGYRERVREVTNRILRAVGEDPRAWEPVVFHGDEANVFSLPGHKIGVYEGMFRFAETDDQLAAVIGHVIGHRQANHAQERLSTQVGITHANKTAALLGAGAQYGFVLPYSRNHELEADRIGLYYMAKAGYDPRASIEFWENMKHAGGHSPAFLLTHPEPDVRIEHLWDLMPQALEVFRGA